MVLGTLQKLDLPCLFILEIFEVRQRVGTTGPWTTECIESNGMNRSIYTAL